MRFFPSLLVTVLLFLSCNNREEEAWAIARGTKNSRELVKFLDYYKKINHKDKYRAACFIVENMPGKCYIDEITQSPIYDIDVVIADSLIKSLECSFSIRDNSPFLKDFSFDDFCEYILPYRVANEPLEYYWKWDCVERFGLTGKTEIREAAKAINRNVYVATSSDYFGDPPRSYTHLISQGRGTCSDRAILAAMALRAAGIPAAFEFVPYWGSSNNGHSFCSAILPDGKTLTFQGDGESGDSFLLGHKSPKIFRKMFAIQKNTPSYKLRNKEFVYDIFSDHTLKDVTAREGMVCRDITIKNIPDSSPGLIYISVFSPNEWAVVDCAEVKNNQATFHNISIGSGIDGGGSLGSNYWGDGILYLPGVIKDGRFAPISNPLIARRDSIEEISVDHAIIEKVKLKRKFPLSRRMENFARNMTGGVFEGAIKKDFSDAELLWKIKDTPRSRIQSININSNKSYRYVRYRKPYGVFVIAEFSIVGNDGKTLGGVPFCCDALRAETQVANAFDSDPLTYYEVHGALDLWIGLDLGMSQKLSTVEFAPRNDDNEISPGDEYELFYWEDEWKSLGIQRADSYTIAYDNVPRGALLRLRNRTKGKEERPFIYRDNGQIWY